MTTGEILLIVIIIALIAFILYYYFRGSSGQVSVRRPMESRVDEYLDRHFEQMVEEWSLMDKFQVWTFRENNDPALTQEEQRMNNLREFRQEMTGTLAGLEERLNVLETEISRE